MKKVFSLILFLAFALQSFSQAIILIDFYIHQPDIASRQCENRFRPMLHCNGQCVLAKKLRQEEQKDQQNPERKLENKNEVISSKSFFIASLPGYLPALSSYYSYSDNSTVDRPSDIFHPPGC